MRSSTGSALILLLAVAIVPAADTNLMNLVMPDARMISGFNIERAKASPFGQFLLSQMAASDPDFEKFVAATGFDPRRDLHEMLFASAGTPDSAHAIVLVRGLFDSPRIEAMAKLNGAIIRAYKGVAVMHGTQRGGPWSFNMGATKADGAFAFLDNTTAVLGDARSLHSVIDRRVGGRGLNPRLAARAQQLSEQYDIWGVSMMPVSEWASKVPDENVSGVMQGDALRSIEQSSGGIRFGKVIEISGEAITRSEKDATALADVIRFLTGLLQLNQKDARITGPAKLLQSLDLRTEGNVMKLSLLVPEAELEKFILEAKAQAQKTAAARKTRAPSGTLAPSATQPSSGMQPPPRRPAPAAQSGGLTIHSSEGTIQIK
ncbi:MAG TPA: hypothetical protein VLE22_00900 [Bryobacteraceae bacterium]|nr:hypothetical protein [Bryobacteraceae bacterium]